MITKNNERIVEIDCSINKDSISELIYNERLKNREVKLNNITSLHQKMGLMTYLKKIAEYQKMGIIIGEDNTKKSLKKFVRLLLIKIKITKFYK